VAVGVLSLLCAIRAFGWVACATNGIVPPSTTLLSQDARQTWQLTLQLTGGFAGIDQQLEMASTGELKVTDRRSGTHVMGQAAASELAQIASIVVNLKSVDPPRESTCRDCLRYELRIRLSERSLLFTIDDVSLSGTSLEPLVNALTTALNRELSHQPNTQRK
jgi:hypothetical protein